MLARTLQSMGRAATGGWPQQQLAAPLANAMQHLSLLTSNSSLICSSSYACSSSSSNADKGGHVAGQQQHSQQGHNTEGTPSSSHAQPYVEPAASLNTSSSSSNAPTSAYISPSSSAPHPLTTQDNQTLSTAELSTDPNASVSLNSAQYASSFDDPFGVQRNWFTALYKQLNYIAKTGQVKAMEGRQKDVFQQVEKEFEHLYNKYVKDKPYQPGDHRSMLMCCLSVATYRILNDEIEDTKLVREIIRTNLGAMMVSMLKPIHRFKLWFLRHILQMDMYKEAVGLLPAMLQDMGDLVEHKVEGDNNETTLTVTKCAYHDMLTQEETPFLLSEFCCHQALFWAHDFRKHGVIVSMDNCMGWDDSCCQLRFARAGHQANPAASNGESGPPSKTST